MNLHNISSILRWQVARRQQCVQLCNLQNPTVAEKNDFSKTDIVSFMVL
jgi:hypothetical protein